MIIIELLCYHILKTRLKLLHRYIQKVEDLIDKEYLIGMLKCKHRKEMTLWKTRI